ncbi:MAG: hypothetical protein AB1352_02730 [Patescibacteria group bacterium]
MLQMSRVVKTIIILLIPLALVLNLFFFHSLIAGILFALIWLMISCARWGSVFAPTRTPIEQMTLGLLTVLILIILAGATYFRLLIFNDFVITAMVILIPLAGIVLPSRTKNQTPPDTQSASNQIASLFQIKNYLIPTILTLAYLALFAYAIIIILHHRTDAPIRTPWEALPHSLLYLYALASFILFFLFSYKEKMRPVDTVRELQSLRRSGASSCEIAAPDKIVNSRTNFAFYPIINIIFIILHFFLTLSLALLVYRIGYGFDPFVHRAAEKIIFEIGTLTPPPLSYLGQYILVVFFSKVTAIPFFLIDLWLLPVLASILLPLVVFLTLKNYQLNTHHYLFTALALLILPSSLFIATVPQSLANLFYLILVLLSFTYLKRYLPLTFLWVLGISILFIHPLTGIPALVFLTFLALTRYTKSLVSRIAFICISIAGALGLPAAIITANRWYGGTVLFSPDILPPPNLFPRYIPFLSLAHTGELWMRALPVIFFIATSTGTYVLLRRKQYIYPLIIWLTALVLFINYLFIRKLPLTAMIAYERPEFTERILELIGLTLLPLFLIALNRFISHIFSYKIVHPRTGIKAVLLYSAILTFLITISFYYTYPRVDAFAKSRAYSVSQTDNDTVHWINDDAKNEPYIVLSNQSVAAAALQEFGFKQYFKLKNCQTANCQNIFYYPIPTSSPLYQYYLTMVYQETSRMTMEQAMDLVDVRRAYFVINSYWLDAEKIAVRASFDANSTITIGTNKVFRYQKR